MPVASALSGLAAFKLLLETLRLNQTGNNLQNQNNWKRIKSCRVGDNYLRVHHQRHLNITQCWYKVLIIWRSSEFHTEQHQYIVCSQLHFKVIPVIQPVAAAAGGEDVPQVSAAWCVSVGALHNSKHHRG